MARPRIRAGISLPLGALALALGTSPATAQSARLAQQSRWFVDPDGRVVLLHGGNVSLPVFDASAPPSRAREILWNGETAQRMREQGFNAVRLVVFFSAVMPQPGQIDHAYLERIARAVDEYAKAGIYTLIDFHQDEYSALVGVRGMPAWAVFSDGQTRLPGVDFPMGYFKDPAVQRAFDNFWRNYPVPGTGKGVQDLYVDGLVAVAQRFRDKSAVLGIDVMNEPATGSRCASPDPATADCPELERELLAPFYTKASRAISRAAPNMMIFVEPFMLQGALGIPIRTPLPAPEGRKGLSFHNYGPVRATRDRVNDYALSQATRRRAAIINTEWGFNNDPVAISGQAGDFDARLIPWLAWTRGAFEALVDPKLPDSGNGNRVAILRAYARPYPTATAGTPGTLRFDGASGVMTYRYTTMLPSARRAGAKLFTEIRVPAIQYPNGYSVAIAGGRLLSAPNAPLIRIHNASAARSVSVTVKRVGTLPPLPAVVGEPDRAQAALAALPPIPDVPLSRNSLFGHIVVTPGGRDLIEAEVPGLLAGMSHVHGWEKMSLAGIRSFASSVLTDAKLARLDAALARLKVVPGPVKVASSPRFSIDSLTSDLLADPRARAILDREAPGLSHSPQQALFPQTRLRNLKPAMPGLLTDAVLERIQQALAAIP